MFRVVSHLTVYRIVLCATLVFMAECRLPFAGPHHHRPAGRGRVVYIDASTRIDTVPGSGRALPDVLHRHRYQFVANDRTFSLLPMGGSFFGEHTSLSVDRHTFAAADHPYI